MGCIVCCHGDNRDYQRQLGDGSADQQQARHNNNNKWKQKWNGLVKKVMDVRHRKDYVDPLFPVLLQLYAHDDVVGKLYDQYKFAPVTFLFYIPQLVNFVVRGTSQYTSSSALDVFVLDKCERSLQFAHRVYWFLAAFAPKTQYFSKVCGAVALGTLERTSLRTAVAWQGSVAARRTRKDSFELVGTRGYPSTAALGAGHTKSLPEMHTEPLPETETETETETDTAAGRRQSTPASAASVAVAVGAGAGAGSAAPSHRESLNMPVASATVTSAASGAASPSVPVNAAPKEGDAAGAGAGAGAAPVGLPRALSPDELPTAGQSAEDAQVSPFMECIHFIDHLTTIADELIPATTQKGRNDQLRQSLSKLNDEYLPSRTLYVPVGNVHNRLIRIHVEESFCFRTKARVPYMVCLEVADYAQPDGSSLHKPGGSGGSSSSASKHRSGRSRKSSRHHRHRRSASEHGHRHHRRRKSRSTFEAFKEKLVGRKRLPLRTPFLHDPRTARTSVSPARRGATNGQGARRERRVRSMGGRRGSASNAPLVDGEAGGAGAVAVAVGPLVGAGAGGGGSAAVPATAGAVLAASGGPVDQAALEDVGVVVDMGNGDLDGEGEEEEDDTNPFAFVTTTQLRPGNTLPQSVPAKGLIGVKSDYEYNTDDNADGRLGGSVSADDGAPGGGIGQWLSPAAVRSRYPRRERARSHGSMHITTTRSGHPNSAAAANTQWEQSIAPARAPITSGLTASGGVSDADYTADKSSDEEDEDEDGDDEADDEHRQQQRQQQGRDSDSDSEDDDDATGAGESKAAEGRYSGSAAMPPQHTGSGSGSRRSHRHHRARRGHRARGRNGTGAGVGGAGSTGDKVTAASPGHGKNASSGSRSTTPLLGGTPSARRAARGDSVTEAEVEAELAAAMSDGESNGNIWDIVEGGAARSGTGKPPRRLHSLSEDATMEGTPSAAAATDDAGASTTAATTTTSSSTVNTTATTATATNGGGVGAGAGGGAGAGAGVTAAAAAAEAAAAEAAKKEMTDQIFFRERWAKKYRHLTGWRLMPIIVKSNDDLRQEQFASQLIRQFDRIFRAANKALWLRPYDILATGPSSGIIEAIPDTISLHALKQRDPSFRSLDDFFVRHFGGGDPASKRLKAARKNFARSLAAYSIVCYLLQIKDRHNGNILIDAEGHIIHIDFGFLFTTSPGGNMNFEAAPFKLTSEYVAVLGGPRSRLFGEYRALCATAFLAARRHAGKIILLVEMMLSGNDELPCFRGGYSAVVKGLRGRLKLGLSSRAAVNFVDDLISQSLDNWRTRWYDKYQRCWQGIF